MTERDTWWREYQLQNVIEGTVVTILMSARKEHLGDMMAEFSDEFRHADGGADRDAMTRVAEREHNKRVFAEAITSVAPRWGLDPAEFTAHYQARDKQWNQSALSDHPAPAGR
jgi:hypothetical protein